MKNLIQAAVVTLFAASAAHAQQAVQWKASDGGNGHWYAIVPAMPGMNAARIVAGAYVPGGHPVSISSAQENQFVIGLSKPPSSLFQLLYPLLTPEHSDGVVATSFVVPSECQSASPSLAVGSRSSAQLAKALRVLP